MKQINIVLCLLSIVLCLGCNPEAKYEVENVNINVSVKAVSAGFVECDFTTDKDAYYLIAIVPAQEGVNPLEHQKQFMTLALDSAYVEYLDWRHDRLEEGEFHVAPFASHALQYGNIDHFFTGLWYDTEYWIYAFVVDPVAMKPRGKLHLVTVKTAFESSVPIMFEYRVNGDWDYIYPIDSATYSIHEHFPYVAITRDSLDVDEAINDSSSDYGWCTTPQEYFSYWLLYHSTHPEEARILYGVSAFKHDYFTTDIAFEEGHTYYTFIGGYDFSLKQNTLYKFLWEGDSTDIYFMPWDNLMLEDDEPDYSAE